MYIKPEYVLAAAHSFFVSEGIIILPQARQPGAIAGCHLSALLACFAHRGTGARGGVTGHPGPGRSLSEAGD